MKSNILKGICYFSAARLARDADPAYLSPMSVAAAAAGLLLSSSGVLAQGNIRSCSDPADPNVREVAVSNIQQLYEAVNTPSALTTKVVLAPGDYYLDRNCGQNCSAHSGRLELQENMLLCGPEGNAELAVIDASHLGIDELTTASGVLTGPIRVGSGDNTIEWLTVRKDLNGAGLIESDLDRSTNSAPIRIRVANSIIEDGQRGIDFRVLGKTNNDQYVTGEFVGNKMRNNTLGMGQGLRATINNATGVTMFLTLQDNTFDSNLAGILASSQTSSNHILIYSSLDVFKNNGVGAWLIGGLGKNGPNGEPSNSNLMFVADRDQFVNNNGSRGGFYNVGGGVVGIGGGKGSSGNRARLEFFNTEFFESAPYVSAFGYSDAPSITAGTNNVLELGFDPAVAPGFVAETQSMPSGAGNAVRRLDLMTQLSQAAPWVGLKNSDDVGTRFDLLAEVYKNGIKIGSGQVNNVAGGSSGFNNAKLDAIPLALTDHEFLGGLDVLSIRFWARVSAASGHRSGTARLWFNDALANSNFTTTIDGQSTAYYLRDAASLATSAGGNAGTRKYVDVLVDRAVGGNLFKPFGDPPYEWKLTIAP